MAFVQVHGFLFFGHANFARFGGPRFAFLARLSISHIFLLLLDQVEHQESLPSSHATFLILKSEIGQIFVEIS